MAQPNKPLPPLKPQQMPDADDFRRKQLQDHIEMVQGALKTAESKDVPQISERIFVGIFLPLFGGDDPLPYAVDLGTWVQRVAGTAYKAVNVIDTQGKVLFVVPPLYDRGAIDPVPADRGSPIAHMVASAGQLALMSPRQGSSYLNAELTKRALVMKVPTNVLAHLETWNEIFKRYGREPLIALDDKPAEKAGDPAASATDDDYEFTLL